MRTFLLVVSSCLALGMPTSALAEAVPVELRETDAGWELFRDGKPYLIRGAGGNTALEQLVAAGGNSIRTWGADDIDELLDQAHELGISVTIGIWLGHERHGFDYADEAQVQEQFERAKSSVLKYRDHPALLIWGIGNEMEGYESGDNPAIWKAVNDIAAMVKELDPNHPTMTVTADIGGGRVPSVDSADAIDIHGINSYGGAPSVVERYKTAGGSKPIVLTEFGPPGAWETGTTEWKAPYELTSTQKAAAYRNSYEATVTNAKGLSLGSYAFIWGFKMEATGTWFGMFLPEGQPLAAVDTMTELWSGSKPANLAPVIESVTVTGGTAVDPGTVINITAMIADPEDKPVTARWVLRPESGEYMTGGDFRPMLPDVEGAIIESDTTSALVRMPEQPGPYRLYLYVYDADGKAATANVPLLINGEYRTPLPFYVYQDSFNGMPWAPSGWMGATDKLTIDGEHLDNARDGEAVIKMQFTAQNNWVGVAWQNPPNNWGEQDGGFDLTGANALELWARGEEGGERISLGVGIIGSEQPHADSARKAVDNVVLTDSWERYEVPLDDLDLSSLKTGFVVTMASQGKPVTIYLDNVRYVRR